MINTDTYSIYIDGNKYNVYNDSNKFTVGKIYRADTYGATGKVSINSAANSISVTLTNYSKQVSKLISEGNVYLTFDYDTCHRINNNAMFYANSMHQENSQWKYSSAHHTHYRQTMAGTNRWETWRCPCISNPTRGCGVNKLYWHLQLTSLISNTFTIPFGSLIADDALKASKTQLSNWANAGAIENPYMTYKFVLYSTRGDGRFIHILTNQFRLHNIFDTTITAEIL